MSILFLIQKITRYSLQKQLIYIVTGIIFLEFCIMLLLDLLPSLPLVVNALVDCCILAILLVPMVYFVIRKHNNHQKEQKKTTDALKESEMHLFTLANTGHALIWTSDSNRIFNYFNLPWLFFTGRPLEQELGDGWLKGIHPDDLSQFLLLYENSFKNQEKFSIEFRLLHSNGEYRWIQNDASPRYNSKGECIGYIGHCLDISVRKQTEAYREASRKILQVLNETGEIHQLIEQVTSILKQGTGIDAIGIRMQQGEDFPFLSQDGFDTDFLLTENSLLHRDGEGSICRDPYGQVCLACTCGAVISGRNDKAYPFSTPGGSWWANESSRLLNIPPQEDTRLFPRNRCIHKGYASLALVPIRDKDKIVGLIQLNDHRKDYFTRIIIEKLEEIASHIGGAIVRKHTEELLRKKDERRLSILKTALDGFWLVANDGRLLEVNETYCRMSGYTEQELLSMYVTDLEAYETEKDTQAHIQRIKALGQDRFETRHRRKDGSTFHIEASVQYQEVEGGQFVTFLHDITERKAMEENLRQSEERYKSLFQGNHSVMLLIDPETGAIKDANPAASRYYGWTYDQLKTKNISDINNLSPMEVIAEMQNAKNENRNQFFFKHRLANGEVRDVEVFSAPIQFSESTLLYSIVHDITERKRVEKALQESEERVKFKLQSILSPEGSIADLELNDIIDAPSIQKLMDNFYELTQLPMAIIDRKGVVLVGVGWQDICTKFHRVHPQACANCLESDIHLTQGIPEGEFKLYKCKNNMWDIATPIIIGGEHKGNLFMGQFFFDSEPIDYALFRDQAKKYGFAEQEYMEALEKAPRINQQKLEHAKAFFLNLSHSISQLSYSNIKLARAITQQQMVEETLREKEELLSKAQEIAHLGSWSLDLTTNQLTWSDEIYRIFGLKVQEFSATYEGFLEAVHPDDREAVNAAYTGSIQEGKDNYEIEHRIVLRNSGEIRHVYEKCQHLRDDSGKIVRSVGMVQDITERKVKEEVLHKLNQTLAALGKSSKVMSQSTDEMEYLNQVCRIIVEDTDFAMVWIGFAEDNNVKSVRPMAYAGFNDNYLESIRVRWDDSDFGRGPTGTCIRTGKMSICNNFLTNPDFEPWRQEALRQGFASSVAFPLKNTERTFGSITIYSKLPDSFLEAEINLLSELANDLSQGINTIRLRAALNKSYTELEIQVKERTKELQVTNDLLKKEIALVKQHQQSLKVAEEKYRTVADHTHSWEFWLDKNDHFIYCSPSCERITGYKASTFLNNHGLLFEIIHPDDFHRYKNHKKSEYFQPSVNHELEYRIVRADGAVRWISHQCQPIYEAGHFMGVRGSNRDITERKKMERLLITSNRKYRLLSENITDGIFIIRNGSFEYVNEAMNHIFGYQGKELIGKTVQQLIVPESQEELSFISSFKSSSNQKKNIEIECERKDQSRILIEFLFNYVAKEGLIYGVVHDITEKRQLQKNIVKAIILTEEKEKAYFSKELHDGLGPLLSTIKIYLQWSEMELVDQSREEIIKKAEDILEEAITTVKEISNKLSPHLLINHGLCSAIESFLDKLEESLPIRMDFNYNLARRLGSEIEAAAYRAIIECINNTIKYAQAKTITIDLVDTGSQLLIQYRDDGIGFDLPETLAVKKGLGLFNLQNRIQNIGGKINLDSEPGKGVNYQMTINL
jgi:PAS domain S-box-containing protein